MRQILTLTELKTLGIGEKFFLFRGGQIYGYHYAGVNPCTPNLVMAISDANLKTVECFSKDDFHTKQVILRGEYNSKDAGEAMIAQLNDRIESIEKIYLKKENPIQP